jgi:hypothetical protein
MAKTALDKEFMAKISRILTGPVAKTFSALIDAFGDPDACPQLIKVGEPTLALWLNMYLMEQRKKPCCEFIGRVGKECKDRKLYGCKPSGNPQAVKPETVKRHLRAVK